MLTLRELMRDSHAASLAAIAQVANSAGAVVALRDDGEMLRLSGWPRVLDDADAPVAVPVTEGNDDVHQVFLDVTGIHSIVALAHGDLYYVHSECRAAPWKLSRLRGAAECAVVAASPAIASRTKDTVSVIVGTSVGFLYEIVLSVERGSGVPLVVREQSAVVLHQLEEQTAIISVRLETLLSSAPSSASASATATASASASASADDVRFFLLFATRTPSRLYYFLWGCCLRSPGRLPAAHVELPTHDTLKTHASLARTPIALSAKQFSRLALLAADSLDLPGRRVLDVGRRYPHPPQ